MMGLRRMPGLAEIPQGFEPAVSPEQKYFKPEAPVTEPSPEGTECKFHTFKSLRLEKRCQRLILPTESASIPPDHLLTSSCSRLRMQKTNQFPAQKMLVWSSVPIFSQHPFCTLWVPTMCKKQNYPHSQ